MNCEYIQSYPKVHDGQNHYRVIFSIGPIKVFRTSEILLDARSNNIWSIDIVHRCGDPRHQATLYGQLEVSDCNTLILGNSLFELTVRKKSEIIYIIEAKFLGGAERHL